MRASFAFTLLCAPLVLCAAACPQTPPSTAASFPDEPYVVTKALTSVTLNPDATSTRVITFAVLVRSDAALRQFGVVTINYASKSERVELVYVRVTRPDGTTAETSVADTMDEPAPVTREAPFYSDLKLKELPVKSLHLGDTLEWQARFIVDHPETPGQAWGQDSFIRGAVSLDETYELRVPPGLHITTWTNPDAPGALTDSDAGGMHLFRWHHTDLRPTVGPVADAFTKAEETRRRTPAEVLDLTKGALPSLTWSTFSDWAAVGAWYRTLSADRTAPDDAIRARVTQLTAGKATDLEKAQAIYNFVSTQIRYIGVSFGIGRYQPHTAAEIFANQYGDCKDKHTLLASMLSLLNLHAEPVLIGQGIRFNPAVATPAAFNHLITRLTLNGETFLLDSTAEVGPWRALVAPIRDQDALVIPAAAPATLIHTPDTLPYPTVTTFTVTGALDKDLTSDSKVVLTSRGDDEIVVRSVLRTVSPAQYGTFVQQFMGGLGFGGTTSEPAFAHLDDTTQPVQLSFHYHRLKEKDWGDNRITLAFSPITLPSFTAERPAVIPIQLGVPRTETSSVEMQLPPGWSAELPAAIHARTPYATCDVTYRLQRDKEKDTARLIAERRLTVLKKEVPLTDAASYQKWYDDAGASGVPYLQLIPPIKPVTTATAPSPEAPAIVAGATIQPPDPHAADLLVKGLNHMKAGDLDSARSEFDEALKINPAQPFLWYGYAGLAGMLGKPTEAVLNLQHEIALHPDETQVYQPLALMQLQLQHPDDALSSLRIWVKAAPTSLDAATVLSRTLQATRHHAEALEEAHSAIARLGSTAGDPSALHLIAANAELSLNHPAEAAAEAFPLLATATTPVLRNDIAYLLAETGTHLDEAAAAQTSVVAGVEDATANWTTEEAPRELFQTQNTLAAYWDTMGWILYKQNKLPEALSCLGAAVRLTTGPVIREHYLAVASALHTPAVTATARRSDQELRTFPLGPARGLHGVAGYTLLLADGKLLTATYQQRDRSSTPTLTGAEDLLRSVDFHLLFPAGSHAYLVRTGFVNCHEPTCELVLNPLSAQ